MCKCKYLLVLLVIGFIDGRKRSKSSKKGIIFNEVPCLVHRGICVKESDCSGGMLAAIRSLCPEQQRRGVICCHTTKLKHKNETLNTMELLKNVTEQQPVEYKGKKKKKKSKWKRKFNRLI